MKANDAMFLGWRAKEGKTARLEIVSRQAYLDRGVSIPCDFTAGAVFGKWKGIPASKIMECVLWTGFDIAESYGVTIGEVTKELEKIDGFIEYWNQVGKRSCLLH